MVSISVVIPNLNSHMIDQTLAALHRQTIDLSDVEVLVVGLDEPGLVKTDHLVQFVSSDEPASPAQNRNMGIRAARGDIICFTDADCVPAPDWLERLTAPYSTRGARVVGGGVTFDYGDYWAFCDNVSWFYKFVASAVAGERLHLPSLNLSVHREAVERVGAFDESYPLAAGEDTEWTRRLRAHGYTLYFEPRAVVHHRGRRGSPALLWKHAYHFGYHSAKIQSRLRATHSPEDHFIPKTWQGLLLMTPLLSWLATMRVVLRYGDLRGVWKAVPGIWLSKIAWCVGASASRRRRRNNG